MIQIKVALCSGERFHAAGWIVTELTRGHGLGFPGGNAMDVRIERISLSLEALACLPFDDRGLVQEAIEQNPNVTIKELRRAALYAVTDPNRADTAVTVRLYALACSLRQ